MVRARCRSEGSTAVMVIWNGVGQLSRLARRQKPPGFEASSTCRRLTLLQKAAPCENG
jgi:hypothetical protein